MRQADGNNKYSARGLKTIGQRLKFNNNLVNVYETTIHCEPNWSMRFGNAIMCDFEFYMNLPFRNVDKVLNFHNLSKKYTFLVK